MALVRDKKDDNVEMMITLFRQGLGQGKLYLPNTYTPWVHFCVYFVVQFYPWFQFYFLLCLGMVMYDN